MKQIAVIDADFIGRKNHRFEVVYKRIHGDFGIFGDEITFGTFNNKDDARRMIADYIAKRNGMEETNG